MIANLMSFFKRLLSCVEVNLASLTLESQIAWINKHENKNVIINGVIKEEINSVKLKFEGIKQLKETFFLNELKLLELLTGEFFSTSTKMANVDE